MTVDTPACRQAPATFPGWSAPLIFCARHYSIVSSPAKLHRSSTRFSPGSCIRFDSCPAHVGAKLVMWWRMVAS